MSMKKLREEIRILKLLKNPTKSLPRSSVITIDKSFVLPHLDQSDIIYDQPNNANLLDKTE